MSKARADKSGKQHTKRVLGLEAFEKISAVEGIYLTAEMKRDLLSFEERGMSSEERTQFIAEKYGRKPA
ncbi:hypothetical protein [Methylobacterium nonmethylotrophicum]|uniref:Antitoxin VbhA domain-containing protein n=1 Tax=Methylobacterium nonmethylotrophicum TaxID=1141884 RepID=A0A4Z0NW61_9HYPH|nr:hypothetical protein [Methylobacterium nonmethylotrophicum]TGE01902.1 hypothetical protein EU555_04330 [Methylobacterium nonmethylotrophicum]